MPKRKNQPPSAELIERIAAALSLPESVVFSLIEAGGMPTSQLRRAVSWYRSWEQQQSPRPAVRPTHKAPSRIQ
jgi:hypothetical protein